MAYVERHNLSLLIVFVITIVCKLHVVSIRYIMTYDKTWLELILWPHSQCFLKIYIQLQLTVGQFFGNSYPEWTDKLSQLSKTKMRINYPRGSASMNLEPYVCWCLLPSNRFHQRCIQMQLYTGYILQLSHYDDEKTSFGRFVSGRFLPGDCSCTSENIWYNIMLLFPNYFN